MFEISTDQPDFVIVNTCSVTSKAAGKSRAKVKKMINEYPSSKIVIAGCSVDNNDIALEGNVVYIKNSDKNAMFEILGIPKKGGVSPYEFRTRQNVIVQTGCNSRCSYCIVPYLRGNEVSRNIDSVISHIKELFESGVKEIVLTGTNLGRYNYKEYGIYELLQRILEVTPNSSRVRLSSIEPWDFDERIILLAKNNKKICPFFHIPLQSGNARILNAMGRNYSLEDYTILINSIKKELPNSMIGTDIIVGFPDETDEEFKETKKFLMDLPIDHFHVFAYSPRKGTVLERTTVNSVDSQTKKQRVATLMEVGKNKKKEFLLSLIDTELEVVIEKKIGESYVGKAENFVDVVVSFSKEELTKGSIQKVKAKSIYKDISLLVELV